MAVQVGVVGVGRWGARLARELDALEGCQIVQICDTNLSRLMMVQDQFPHIAPTAAYEELLANESLEAIVVATPAETHYELALAALEAGKHLMVEAPLAATLSQADRLVEEAARRKRIVAVGHTLIYHPAVSEMKTMISLGEVGRLYYMESGRLNMGLATSGAAEDALWSLAIHDVAIALYLAGERPVEVSGIGRDAAGNGLLDVAFVAIRYQSGLFSQHHVSWLSPHRVRRFFVSGAESALVFSDNRQADKLRVFAMRPADARPLEEQELEQNAADMAFGLETLLPPDDLAGERESPMTRQCLDFINCLEQGGAPLVDGASGREVVRVLAAAGQSIRQNSRPISLA